MWVTRVRGVRFLCEAAVCAKYLRVHPSAIRSGKEGDNACDIVWLAEAFQRRQLTKLSDLLFCLVAKEKFCRDRSGGDRIHRDFVSAEFICKHMHQAFNACLGSDIGAVGGEVLSEDAAGEGDDTAALGDVLRCLREDEEGSAQVRGNDLVECLDVAFGDGREGHDTCVIDDHVDLAEGLEGLLEELLDVFRVGNVGLDGEGAASSAGDLADDLFCLGCVACVVDDDAKSIGREAKSDGTSDAAGCAGYDGCLSHSDSPFGGFFELEVRR